MTTYTAIFSALSLGLSDDATAAVVTANVAVLDENDTYLPYPDSTLVVVPIQSQEPVESSDDVSDFRRKLSSSVRLYFTQIDSSDTVNFVYID